MTAWVVIRPDDTVVIRIARSEMGQGTMTGLAQLVAEELECDWSKVTTEFPTPGENLARNRVWGDSFTAGSRGIRESNEYVRKAGATARTMLIQAAANEWKVPASECSASNSVITHKPVRPHHDLRQGRRSRGQDRAAEGRAAQGPEGLEDRRQTAQAARHRAQAHRRAQIYGLDLKLPGMLCAAIKDCPVFGGKLTSFDAAKVQGMPGVKHVVKVGDSAVAVVAERWWQAKTALDALPATWDEGPNAKVSSATHRRVPQERARRRAGLRRQRERRRETGHRRRGEEGRGGLRLSLPEPRHHGADERDRALYRGSLRSVGAHASRRGGAGRGVRGFRPADSTNARSTRCRSAAASAGAPPTTSCRRRVAIAKQIPGTPVKLIWSREEDMTHGRYHPVTQAKMVGAFDANNNLTGLHMRISGQSILAFVNPQGLQNGKDPFVFQGLNAGGTEGVFGYTIPNLLIDHAMRNPHVPPHFWRGVNNNQNAIYLECFMDELAHAVGQDPLEFRRKLMANHPKHLPVLNAVAERAGWGKPAPQGRLSRPLPTHGLRQLCGGVCRSLGQRQGSGEDPPHRCRDRPGPRG